jgi:permuted papain-like amidase YaeF/Yiix C92 family enzyme
MNIYPKTKHEKLRLTILLILLFGIFIYQYAIPFYWYKKYIPEEADIIFQSLPKMDLVEAIEGVTKSPYSHVGILIKKNDSWYVREAIIDVHDTPLFRWIIRGRLNEFAVFRLKRKWQSTIPDFINATEKYMGRPYDVKYELDDTKIYCSELVYKSFKDATNKNLGKLVALGNMNWQPYEDTIKKYEEGEPPLDRLMVSPRHLSESEYLQKVFSNGL